MIEEFNTLDVGCGPHPRGKVNCDMFKDYTPEYSTTKLIKVKGKNLVCCSGEHLPFKDGVFKQSISFHVIEHSNNPYLFLKEIIRVTNGKVIIKCPHRFGKLAKMPYHRQYFSRAWFGNQLTDYTYGSWVSAWRFVPFDFLTLFKVPEEITIRILTGV